MRISRESAIKLASLGVTALLAKVAEHVTGTHGLSETVVAGAGFLKVFSEASFGHIGAEFVHGLAHGAGHQEEARHRENHDLHRLIGETVAHVLERSGSPADRFGSDWLRRAAASFRGEPWMNIELEGAEHAVSEPAISAFFTGDPEVIKASPVLSEAEWKALLEKVAGPTRTKESDSAVRHAAVALQKHFAFELWECAKHAWKTDDLAWPALTLRMLTQILGATSSSAAELARLSGEVSSLREAVLQQAKPAMQAAPAADALVQAIGDYSGQITLQFDRMEGKLDKLQTGIEGIQASLANPRVAPVRERWIGLPNTRTEILARDMQAESLLTELRADGPSVLSIAAPPGFGKSAVFTLALRKLFAGGEPPESVLNGIAVLDAKLDTPGTGSFANRIGRITGLQDAATQLASASGDHTGPEVRFLFFDFLRRAGKIWLVVENTEALLAPAAHAKSEDLRSLLHDWSRRDHDVKLLFLTRHAIHPAPAGHHQLRDIEDALLGGLPLVDAITVLRRNLRETRFHTTDEKLLRQAAEKLHRIPMALEQFAAYLRARAEGVVLNQHFLDRSDLLRLDATEQLPRLIRENLELLDSPSLHLLRVAAWAGMSIPASGMRALAPDADLLLTGLVRSNQLSVKEGTAAEGRSLDTHPLIREALVGKSGDGIDFRQVLRTFAGAGRDEWDRKQFQPALSLCTLSERAARLVDDPVCLARAVRDRGGALHSLGRLDEALVAYTDGVANFRTLVESEGRLELRNDLAMAIMNRAISLRSLDRLAEAVAACDEAIAICRLLINEGHLELRNELAMAIMNRANSLYALGQLEEAVAAYDEAIAIRRILVKSEGRLELRNDLAMATMNRANALHSLGQLEEAVAAYDEAIAIRHILMKSEGRLELRNELAMAIMNRANSLLSLDRVAEAVAAYDEAIAVLRSLVEGEGRLELRNDLAMAIVNRAISLRSLGRFEEAVEACDQAIAIRRALVMNEGRLEIRNELARAIMSRANSLDSLGRFEEAVAAYDQAIVICQILVTNEGRLEIRNDLARAIMNRAVSLDSLDRLEEAVAAYAAAIAMLRTLVVGEGRLELRPNLAVALYNLAGAHERRQRPKAALAAASEARRLLENCVREGMRHHQGDLDRAHAREARLARATEV